MSKYSKENERITKIFKWTVIIEALCQECHNKEHHAKSERKTRYRFTEDGNITPPLSTKKF